MKRFIILLITSIVTFTIMLAIYRPDILENIWLWVVGLAGPVVGILQELSKSIKKYFKSKLQKN